VVDQHHRGLRIKPVQSGKDDKLETIKAYVLNAAHRQGMNQDTVVTALADGAKNCWSVISHIKSHCQRLEPILDWFDIGKVPTKKALGEF